MKQYYILFIFCLLQTALLAQKTIISGKVLDKKTKEPLIGANIYLRDTYDGATTGNDGSYSFETEETGDQVLEAGYVGYDSLNMPLQLKGGNLEANLLLRESFNELKVVVISAGSFEASDERKVTVLKPLDIVTTASAGGDTYGALKTLPGTQVSTGEESGLFVRGGSGTEAQTFIDGMLVRNPFAANVPDIAARGRFSPFLFKGTVFSTGGYSAQYGQGMSSALILETQDLPDRSAGTLAVSSVGLGFGQQKLWRKKGMALGGGINYTNLAPYFSLIKQKQSFNQMPEYIGSEVFFRKKTAHNGMFKGYAYLNTGRVGFSTMPTDSTTFGFGLKNLNMYSNVNWSAFFGEHWKISLGTSFAKDKSDIASSYNTGFIAPDTFHVGNSMTQLKAVATRYFGKLTTLRFGSEYQFGTDNFKDASGLGELHIDDHYGSLFAESDLYLTTSLVARLGVRAERSTLADDAKVSPRVSLAYKLNDGSQVSFAWGHFYQKGDSLLRWQAEYQQQPGFQRAEHFILNYQYILNDRTFRVEGFYKKYQDLVTTGERIANEGNGYAKGFEVFYRDKKSVKGFDFWLSYSWLDTKRRFQWYPVSAQPTYAANHVATLVAKKFFPKISTSVGMSYNFATGRPYYNPNLPLSEFLSERTPAYNNLSINASYLTTIKKAFAVFVLGVTNVLNQDQVFGYRYSADGSERYAITPPAKQFIFLGAFISWGTDRRQEVLDGQN